MKKQFKNLIFTLFLVFTLVFVAGCELPQGTGTGGTNIEPETLQVPSDFQVTSGTKCNATWTVDENAVTHKIYIYKDNELFNSLSGTSGVEIELEENGTYQAAIKVIGDGTYFYSSDLSEKVTFEYTGGINAELPKLATPTNVTVSYNKENSQLTINFKDSADYINATGYKAFIYKNSTLVNSYSLSRNGGYITAALEDGTYKVKVKVLGNNETYQDSVLSTEVSFKISSGSTSTFDYTSYNNYYIKAKDLTGDNLEEMLRTIITNTHKKKTSYEDLKTVLQKSDADPNNSSNVITFYSQQSVKGKWDSGNTWNREHVWPNSKGVGKTGPGADAHHLRPEDPDVNSTRSSYKMGYVTTNKKEIMFKKSTHTYCYYGGGYFEPRDEVKGDIARIYFYLLTRYEDLYSNFSSVADMTVLLEWNELDPVSDSEIRRNTVVYGIQGNRNPFIDNSDFANLIWG